MAPGSQVLGEERVVSAAALLGGRQDTLRPRDGLVTLGALGAGRPWASSPRPGEGGAGLGQRSWAGTWSREASGGCAWSARLSEDLARTPWLMQLTGGSCWDLPAC